MAFKFFKKKPAARIKLGNTFLGESISATAEGYVIYKQWDAADKKNYYWEEWELRGFNDYDSWIEYDHYTRKISLYEPLKPKEFVDPSLLTKGQVVNFTTRRGEAIQATVSEVGVGTAVRREGTLTHHVFEGDKVAYAECAGPQGRYCIEKYNDKEIDIYKMQVLTNAQQKKLLGRTVSPGLWGNIKNTPLLTKIYVLIFGGIMAFSIVGSALPQYQSFCTPRTATPTAARATGTSIPLTPNPTTTATTSTTASTVLPTDEVTSQDAKQTCYRRRVYSGGGGGVGK